MNRFFLLLLLSLATITSILGQSKYYYFTETVIKPEVEVVPKLNNMSVEEIIKMPRLTFSIIDSIHDIDPKMVYWLKFDFTEFIHLFDQYDTIYLVTINFDNAYFFKQMDNSIVKQRMGLNTKPSYKSALITRSFFPIRKIELINDRYIIVKVTEIFGRNNWRQIPFYLHHNKHQISQENKVLPELVTPRFYAYLFSGLAIGFFLLNILIYFNSKNKVYLYYSLFIFFQAFYYLRLTTALHGFWEYYFPLFFRILIPLSQILINLTYLLFIKAFLNMKQDYPFLNRLIAILIYILSALILTEIILLVSTPNSAYQPFIMNAHRLLMTLFTIFGVFYLYLNKKSNFVYFVIIATLIFLSGALITLFTGSIEYMILCAGLESIVFATGLAYRIKAMYDEKYNIEKEASYLSQSVLRAQLNPHFIFNSLSSIQYLISSDDKCGALKYLGKFSHLVRQILENSIELNVSLKREIELLKLYLELESLRFNNSFHFEFDIDNKLDTDNQEIPLFLIQPYVENAIIHGLLPKKNGTKTLTIIFIDAPEHIQCIIRDNGIGREAASLIEKVRHYLPRGLSVSEKRIQILNKNKSLKTSVIFEDSPNGTTVNIIIPKI
ncbi:histidine kinase [Marivirga sp. S37H4]|uniref:Histidine kinase n=1 Tax=Marivirga aurantiaca TaxID=2802615 RepID=A0A934WWU3_9BACT|nr:histidine kinase [Marivirga aurantiaca]MBK6264330.1 histidine kinase [Marivirga aurantiaca]